MKRLVVAAALLIATQSVTNESATASELAWQTYNEAGDRFVKMAKFSEAEEVLKLAIDAARQMHSDDHLKTSLSLIVKVYDSLQKTEQAESARKELSALGVSEPQNKASVGVSNGERIEASSSNHDAFADAPVSSEGTVSGGAQAASYGSYEDGVKKFQDRGTEVVSPSEVTKVSANEPVENTKDSELDADPGDSSTAKLDAGAKDFIVKPDESEQKAAPSAADSAQSIQQIKPNETEVEQLIRQLSGRQANLRSDEVSEAQGGGAHEIANSSKAGIKDATTHIASNLPPVAATAVGANATEVKQLAGHIDYIRTISFAPDTNYAASAGYDQIIRYWDISSGKQLAELAGHKGDIFAVSFSSDGSKILSASADTTVRLFDVASAKQERVFNGHTNVVNCVAFSPDMKRAVSGDHDKNVIVWDLESGSKVGSLEGHTGVVHGVLFSPDGNRIISCSDDTTIRIWDARTFKAINVLQGHEKQVLVIEISEDGKQLLSGSRDLTVRLWDLIEGKELQVLRGHRDWILRAKFVKGSNNAITGSMDKTVRIWDLSTGALQSTVGGFDWGLWGEDFAVDKRQVLTGSNDKTVRVWSLPN